MLSDPKTETDDDEDFYVFKVIVAGPSSVGKTCLVQRFVDDRFVGDTKSTIGVDFSLKNVDISEDLGAYGKIALQIWDMAGEKRFRDVLPYYIAGTQGIVLAFDSTNPETLADLYDWIKVIRTYLPQPNVPVILISTKGDLPQKVDQAKIDEFVASSGSKEYHKTSSKEGTNVHLVFQNLTRYIIKSKLM